MKNNLSESLYQKTFDKALFFLKFRQRSQKEVENYLKKYAPVKVIEEVIKRLKELDFVNDYKFAIFWIEKRLKINLKGKSIIIRELKQKGIPKEIIDKVLEKEIVRYPQDKIIKTLLEKAQRRYHQLPYQKKREKLINFVVRRGFSFTETSRIVDEMFGKGVK